MPSSEEGEGRSSPEISFQSAQLPVENIYADDEELSIARDKTSDISSDAETTPPQSRPEEIFADEDGGAGLGTVPEDRQHANHDDSMALNSPPSRPNQFRGPPSTWRNWTSKERDLATSLDLLQAKDLSIHLYNAFKLKGRNRTLDRHSPAKYPQANEEGHLGSTWVPPKLWTAWPLSPDSVPREQDEKRWGESVILPAPYVIKPRRPGQALMENLVAQVLRRAKERLEEREWDDIQPTIPATRSTGPSRKERRDSMGQFSQPGEDRGLPNLTPVVMADDERAMEILRPTVQHIMTKMEGLLMGLHHARSAYLAVGGSHSESQSRASGRSASRSRQKKRRRKASTSGPDTAAISDMSLDSPSNVNVVASAKSGPRSNTKRHRASSHRTKSQTFPERKARLGLRDWSDILGVASMTGWDSDIVQKAAARCSTLFGEGITFRTLTEGKEDYDDRMFLPNVSSVPDGGESRGNLKRRKGDRSDGGFEKSEEMAGGVHVDGFLQPIEGKKSWKYSRKQRGNASKAQ